MCNEENETKKLFLRQYQASRRREKEIAEELAALEAAYLPKSPNIDGMPHGGSGADLATFAARYDELYAKLKKQQEHSINVYHHIIDAIETMEAGEDAKTLLRYRYILGKTWEEIAVLMHYTYRHTTRLHGAALQKLGAVKCP